MRTPVLGSLSPPRVEESLFLNISVFTGAVLQGLFTEEETSAILRPGGTLCLTGTPELALSSPMWLGVLEETTLGGMPSRLQGYKGKLKQNVL